MHNSAMKPRETDYAAPEMDLLELLVEQVAFSYIGRPKARPE